MKRNRSNPDWVEINEETRLQALAESRRPSMKHTPPPGRWSRLRSRVREGALNTAVALGMLGAFIGFIGLVYFLGAIWTPFWSDAPWWAWALVPAVFALSILVPALFVLVGEIRDHRRIPKEERGSFWRL